jgi:hypothetical protein
VEPLLPFQPRVRRPRTCLNVAADAVKNARLASPGAPVVARILDNNPSSSKVAVRAGLSLRWQGSVGKAVDRLIFADRELDEELIASLSSLG